MANVQPKATIDFESRSACSLKAHGTWRYSIHPSTEILCLVFRLPHWEPGRTSVWHPAMPALNLEERCEPEAVEQLFDWIADGGLVEAHNVWFEYCIWANVLVARHGWPAMSLEQWRCSAAKAAAHALPRALGDAAKALKLALQKDEEGAKVMKKMAKPRKSRKAEREAWVKAGATPPEYLWWESIELLDRLIAYCRVDVLAEEALSHVLDDLSPAETQMFLMDLRINARGFQLDKRAVQVALRLIHQEAVVLNQELTLLTDRQVRKATQRGQMLAWLAANGLDLPDTQKATIDGLLQAEGHSAISGLDPKVRRALGIMRALGRSSTAKYGAMRDWMARNGRVFGGLLYHGASTGRWSGKGPQVQNFPKPTIKADGNEMWSVIKYGDRQKIIAKYGDVMEALSSALRGAITAAAGLTLYVADYASIEARVVLWLAADTEALDVFRQGKDIYLEMAEAIYGYPCNKTDHPVERTVSKVAVLGLSYAMGASKFWATCEAFGLDITEEFAKQVVDTYREKFWRVKQLWADLEAGAIKAVKTGKRVFTGKVVWFTEGRFLYCQLPSGRKLAYPYPEVKMTEMRWGGQREALSFMGVDSYSRKWKRLTTYGGMLCENCLAEGTPVLTTRGWVPIQDVVLSDRVWDGIAWVSHGGVVYNGVRPTICIEGLYATTEHLALSTQGWRQSVHLSGLEWAPCRRPRNFWLRRMAQRTLALARRVFTRTQEDVSGARYSDDGRSVFRVSCRVGEASEVPTFDVGQHADAMSQSSLQGLQGLWRTWDYHLRTLGRVRQFLAGHGVGIPTGANNRSDQQRRELRTEELSLGNENRSSEQHPSGQPQRNVRPIGRRGGSWLASHIQPVLPGPVANVYDITNCGPRQRFVVAGGRIVHNCTQAAARDIMAEAMLRLEASENYQVVMSIHDELVSESPKGVGSVTEYENLLTELPTWAKGCPIGAEGWTGFRYRK